ncbi:hypothetical protein CFC21_001872 [Triticum aestivum]|uniref:Uncharacterized protein n=2 Tax=Triticum TaxID=4564 RepID=A0A9R0Q768_TRITD|nr:hypothetical protein CFC21_001872 [Triticum aestivum]VAH05188.1 unnamed protein product [Triticum turgidum subsp. durum]
MAEAEARIVVAAVAARVVVAEAAVRVEPPSGTGGGDGVVLAAAELLVVISNQEVPLMLLGSGHVGQKTPELAPVACSRSELGLPLWPSK